MLINYVKCKQTQNIKTLENQHKKINKKFRKNTKM